MPGCRRRREDDRGHLPLREARRTAPSSQVYWVGRGHVATETSRGHRDGIVDGPDAVASSSPTRRWDRRTALDAGTIAAIAADPLVGLDHLAGEQRGRRTHRGVPDARPRGPRRRGGVRRVDARRASPRRDYIERMIDRDRLRELRAREESASPTCTPAPPSWPSGPAARCWPGVPMPWMTRWPGRFPRVLRQRRPAPGSTDVDGLEYVDLCLGDTGAMTGHALPQVAEAIAARARTGHHHDAARRPTRSGSARSWPAGSGCRRGSWRCRPPTRTGSCCASPGT